MGRTGARPAALSLDPWPVYHPITGWPINTVRIATPPRWATSAFAMEQIPDPSTPEPFPRL